MGGVFSSPKPAPPPAPDPELIRQREVAAQKAEEEKNLLENKTKEEADAKKRRLRGNASLLSGSAGGYEDGGNNLGGS